MIFNCNIRFIGVNFSICMSCKIPEDCGILYFNSRFQFLWYEALWCWQIFQQMYWQTLSCLFLYSVGLPDSRELSNLQFHHIDYTFYIRDQSHFLLFWLGNFWCKGFGLTQPWKILLFQLSDPHYEATDGCILDQHQLVEFAVGIGHARGLFSQVSFICLRSTLLAFLFSSFACSAQVVVSFVWSC